MSIFVNGMVAMRDKQPFVAMDVDGKEVQLSVSAARQVALDLVQAASRAEADAMIFKFFDTSQFPPHAAAALMVEFRDFRAALDADKAERPDAGRTL
jgi:hypothetical protein